MDDNLTDQQQAELIKNWLKEKGNGKNNSRAGKMNLFGAPEHF